MRWRTRRPRAVAYLTEPRSFVDRLLGRTRFEQPNPRTEVEGLELIRDSTPHIEWLTASLTSWKWPMRLSALVPTVFERYARILHPVRERDGGVVTWARVAEWAGQTRQRDSWFEDIATRADGERWPGSGPGNPLQSAAYERLTTFLSAFTTTPDLANFLLWEGDGLLHELGEKEPERVTLREDAGRRYFLFQGPVRSLMNLRFLSTFLVPPNFWWPQDRSWFVGSEVDGRSTYVGGSAETIERLISLEGFEVVPAEPDDPWEGCHDGQTNWF
jgi:hypothetical protein